MKVLQINTTINTGSTGRITEGIGQNLLVNGHKSYVAYGRGDRPSKSKKIKIGNTIDVYTHVLKTVLTDRHGFGSVKATNILIKEIDSIKPDVIGLHNLHGYYIHIGLLFEYLSKKKTPVIWTFHDSWPYTGHCTFYESVDCIKWQTECNYCPKTGVYPRSIALDQSSRNFKDKKSLYENYSNLSIVTPSYWLKQEVKKSFFKNHPTYVIPNGIDVSVFKPIYHQGEPREKVVLGVASTWDKRKGLEDFIELSTLISEDFQIVLIGLSLKQKNSLPSNMIGIKRTENIEELVTWYNKALIFINPTWQDNFPTTNLEALACGTPVITYNTGGSPEAIDSKTGYVVEKGDLGGVVDAIKEIDNNGKKHYSPHCRDRAIRFYNKEDRYNDYVKLYEKILIKNA